MRPKKFETGSSGFVWQNIDIDPLLSDVKFHVYTAHNMKTGIEWAGDQFINHYNRLYYVESGEAVLVFKDREILLKPGFLYLIPAYQLVSHYAKGDFHFLWAHFQAQLPNELDLFMVYGEPKAIDCATMPDLKEGFYQLIDTISVHKSSNILKRNMLLMKLLLPFIDAFSAAKLTVSSFKHQALIPLVNLINQNVKTAPTVSELALKMNMSPEHFSRKFKTAFNISPSRYILAKRIELAKQLLMLTSNSIEQIAEKCGFCDLYHFSRTFKQETRLSPSAFRKSHLIEK